MDLITLFAFVLGLAVCVGLNPYLSLFTIIFIAKSGFITSIPEPLHFVQQDMFITMIFILMIIDLIIELTPGIDTMWDIVQTVMRIPIAILLAMVLLDQNSQTILMAGFGISFIASTIMHFGKSSLRAHVNGRVHPGLNWGVALLEIIIVVTMIAFIVHFPYISYVFSLILLVLAIFLINWYWRSFHHLSLHILQWLKKRKGWKEEDSFFD